MTVVEVTGSITIRERIAIPDGAVGTVKLVDAAGEVLAAAAIEVSGVPADFHLTVDPALIADPDGLLVWALLRSEVGGWGTLELVPVTGDRTDVVLTRLDD